MRDTEQLSAVPSQYSARNGVEALTLILRIIVWYESNGERYLVVGIDPRPFHRIACASGNKFVQQHRSVGSLPDGTCFVELISPT